MKITLRIPTKDPYAYAEIETETPNTEESIKDAKDTYDKYFQVFQEKEGLSDSAFNDYLIRLFDSNLEEYGDINDYHEQMTDKQRQVVQAIKRMSKRTQ